jgi:hypothetical protein
MPWQGLGGALMERFVFIAAVTFAIIWGIVAVVGRGDFGIHIDGDEFGGGVSPLVETAPGAMQAQPFAGSELRIRHAAANVTITPEDRQDFIIEITNPGRAPMPTVEADDGAVVINGQLRGRVDRCLDGGGAALDGYGELALADLPQITIRAPRSLNLELNGASTTSVAVADAVTLDLSGCGSVNVADVTNDLDVDLAGSGDVRAGAARRLTADVAGSGTLTVGAVAEQADVDLAGSGVVTIASISGGFSADGAGSGTVNVQGGAVTDAKIDLAGSGDVVIAAPVQRLNVSILGSGDVDVQGDVVDLDAEIAGSGSVTARAVTGSSQREVMGSGEVRIGTAQTP